MEMKRLYDWRKKAVKKVDEAERKLDMLLLKESLKKFKLILKLGKFPNKKFIQGWARPLCWVYGRDCDGCPLVSKKYYWTCCKEWGRVEGSFESKNYGKFSEAVKEMIKRLEKEIKKIEVKK